MESLILMAILNAAPHWPLVAYLAACLMAMADMALAGWAAVCVAFRCAEWAGLHNTAPQAAPDVVQSGRNVS